MLATAASAPSKMTFSVSCTLICRPQLVEDVREHAGAIAVAHDQPVRRRRARREVHHVRHAAGLLKTHDADRLGGDRLLRLVGRGADVVGAVDAGSAAIGRANVPVPPAGSSGKTSSPTRMPRRGPPRQRRVVHHLGPRGGVDEDRAGPQAVEDRRRRPSSVSPGVSARCTLRTSLSAPPPASRRGHTRCRCRVQAAGGSAVALNRRLHTTVVIPNAAARRAISWPMLPKPSRPERPAVEPAPSSTPSCSSARHVARRRCRDASVERGSSRTPARRRRSFLPGQFDT